MFIPAAGERNKANQSGGKNSQTCRFRHWADREHTGVDFPDKTVVRIQYIAETKIRYYDVIDNYISGKGLFPCIRYYH